MDTLVFMLMNPRSDFMNEIFFTVGTQLYTVYDKIINILYGRRSAGREYYHWERVWTF